MRWLRAAGLLAMLPAGCVTGPLFDNPMRVAGPSTAECDDPAQIATSDASGTAYAELFDQALDAVDDFFPIQYANRYEGRILGKTTIAPGYEQPWKPGSPDHYERLLVTLQPYRYRCELRIREAAPSGYFVQVTVRKELKDYPAPSNQFVAIPVFGDVGTVDRDQFLVVDPDVTSPITNPGERWIPKGRDIAIEQAILQKLQQCP
jgi:hypothetical protein